MQYSPEHFPIPRLSNGVWLLDKDTELTFGNIYDVRVVKYLNQTGQPSDGWVSYSHRTGWFQLFGPTKFEDARGGYLWVLVEAYIRNIGASRAALSDMQMIVHSHQVCRHMSFVQSLSAYERTRELGELRGTPPFRYTYLGKIDHSMMPLMSCFRPSFDLEAVIFGEEYSFTRAEDVVSKEEMVEVVLKIIL